MRRGVVGSVVVAVVLLWAASSALGSDADARRATGAPGWTVYGFDVQHTGTNPFEHSLTRANVHELDLDWDAETPDGIYSQPVIAKGVTAKGVRRDLLIVGDDSGRVTALDAGTGHLVWKRDLGTYESDGCGTFGIYSSPALDLARHRVYVVTPNGKAFALALGTGATVSGWPVVVTTNPKHEISYSAAVLSPNGAHLYAQLSSHCDNEPYKGKVVSISPATHRITDTLYVVPKSSSTSGGGVWGMAGAAIDPEDGDVYTATGNSLGEDEHAGYSERVIRMHADLSVDSSDAPPISGQGDEDFGATTTLFTPPGCEPMLAAKNKSGVMFLYERNHIEDGPIQGLRMEKDDSFFQNQPAWSARDARLYVTISGTAAGGFAKGVVALKFVDCRAVKAWQRSVGPFNWVMPSPSVANGVVYVTSADSGHVVALNSATGAHLWTSDDQADGALESSPIVLDGRVYVASSNGHVYAYSR